MKEQTKGSMKCYGKLSLKEKKVLLGLVVDGKTDDILEYSPSTNKFEKVQKGFVSFNPKGIYRIDHTSEKDKGLLKSLRETFDLKYKKLRELRFNAPDPVQVNHKDDSSCELYAYVKVPSLNGDCKNVLHKVDKGREPVNDSYIYLKGFNAPESSHSIRYVRSSVEVFKLEDKYYWELPQELQADLLWKLRNRYEVYTRKSDEEAWTPAKKDVERDHYYRIVLPNTKNETVLWEHQRDYARLNQELKILNMGINSMTERLYGV